MITVMTMDHAQKSLDNAIVTPSGKRHQTVQVNHTEIGTNAYI